MKKMRKLLAVLMTLAMVMGLGMTSLAYDAITISINNKGNGTFAKLQLIKTDTKADTGWNFVTDDIAEDFTDAFGITSSEEAKAPTEEERQKAIWMLIGNQDEKDTTYTVTLPEGVVAATDSQIAVALTNVKNGHNFGSMEHTANITVTEPGVYYIDGKEDGYVYSPMAAYVSFVYNEDGVPSTLACAGVEAKKTPTTVKKEVVDDNLVTEIGKTNTYKITGTVPYIPMTDTGRTYYVTDTISGADYVTEKEDGVDKVVVVVKIGDEITTAGETGETYYGKLSEDGSSFTVNLDAVIANNTHANKNIEISYQAVVTDTTVVNEVVVNDGKFGKASVTIWTGKATLTKYASDADNENLTDNDRLANAGFVLYKEVVEEDGTTSKLYAQFDSNNKFVAWGTEAKATIVYTTVVVKAEDGTVTGGDLTVYGLDVGKYYFKEVVAPEGYSVNETPEDVTLAVGEAGAASVADGTYMIDTKLNALPSTGGIGTTIFTIGGCAIMVAAAYMYFVSRRREEEQ